MGAYSQVYIFQNQQIMKSNHLKSFPILVMSFSVICFTQTTSLAQQSTIKPSIYKAWTSNIDRKLVGALYEVTDTGLKISNSMDFDNYATGDFQYVDIYARDIETIKLRKKGKIGRGILIGALSGFATGALIGLISGDDDCESEVGLASAFCHIFATTAEQKAISNGVFLGVTGGLIGAVVGSIKIKIPINGAPEKFKANRDRLTGLSLRAQLIHNHE